MNLSLVEFLSMTKSFLTTPSLKCSDSTLTKGLMVMANFRWAQLTVWRRRES